MRQLSQREQHIRYVASHVDTVRDGFNIIRSNLDWDVRSRNGIDTSMRDIYRELSQLEDDIHRLADYIKTSTGAYEQAEKDIFAILNDTGDHSRNESSHPTYDTYQRPYYQAPTSLEKSLRHIGDFFRKIGQSIVDLFLPNKGDALDVSTDFIEQGPYRSIAYSNVGDIDIPPITGDFNYTGRPILESTIRDTIGDTTIDMADMTDATITQAIVWPDVWGHMKEIGKFASSTIEEIIDLARKHGKIMETLPGELMELDNEPWMKNIHRIGGKEEQYKYAISQISDDKEVAHAMMLAWMATDPKNRGIDTKYYAQLLATLMLYKDKSALTVEEIDAKYQEIYNRNEAAIKRAKEKEQDQKASVLDKALEWTHTTLDIVGWIPMLGDACDLINAGLYVMEGNLLDAALSCIAFIPAVGQGLKGILKKIFNAGDDAKAIAKILSKIGDKADFLKKLKSLSSKMIDWIKNLPKAMGDMLDSPFIKKILGGAKDGIAKIINGVSSTIDNVAEWIQKQINGIIDKLSPPKVKATNGIDVNVSDVNIEKMDAPDVPKTPVQENYNKVMNEAAERSVKLSNAVVSEGLENTAKLADSVKLNGANRIDYSYSFKSEEVNFVSGFKSFDAVQEDMILVQFHSANALGDGRSVKYWTTMEQASEFKSVDDVKDHLALLDEWGGRDAVSVAKVPAGTKIDFKVGKARSQTSLKTGQSVNGNGTQILFNEFNPDWITEVKHATEFFN